MSAFYNEIDAYAASWLGNLVEQQLIAPGRVETRSIVELEAREVAGATQAHFFAGLGGWSYALRLAGWPDDLPVWTGSCPCQPFSDAGRRRGFDDERHLWPAWFGLIRECRPAVLFGEQVASPAARAWLDAVSADLEDAGYAVAAADLCAAGVGAPHRRQRIYWMAVAGDERRQGLGVHLRERRSQQAVAQAARGGAPGALADAASVGRGRRRGVVEGDGAQARDGRGVGDAGGEGGGRDTGAVPGAEAEGDREWGAARYRVDELELAGAAGGLADADVARAFDGRAPRGGRFVQLEAHATAGFWADAEWIYCRDGRVRPVEPGSFPLAHGVPGRVGKLRAYGNAIVAPQAAAFVEAAIDIL